MERRYDLVIWGGTGFTGQLMAQHPKHRLLLGGTQIASSRTVWEVLTRGL